MTEEAKTSKPSRFPAWARWATGAAIVVAAIAVAFRVSPWPGVFIIRMVFDQQSAKLKQAMEAHQPKVPVSVLATQAYRNGDDDAVLDVYYPQSAQGPLPVLIWTHGGAWVSGSRQDAAPYFKLIAAEGYTVISLGYTLAPGKHYATQIHQINDAYAYIQQNAQRFHADTSRIFLAGDSAGSQISSQMAALITSPSYASAVGLTPSLQPAQLKGVILYCGIYQMDKLATPAPTVPKLVGWGTDITVWAYSGTRDTSAPVIQQMSPYYHVTKDFPPAFISGGNADPLTDVQSKPLVEKLQSLGVNVDTLFFPPDHQPQLPHEYQFNLDNADGQAALARSLQFLKTHSQ